MSTPTIRVEIPAKIGKVLSAPRGDARYRVLYGGRGSGKSFSAALMAAIWGASETLRILCAREFQNSIRESMHAEIKNAIQSNEWLDRQYDVGVDYIRHKTNGTEFIFRGLRNNISAIKSMAQIDLCIIEEGETVPESSYRDLIPTIRADKSEFWIIFNPKRRDSWVAKTFLSESLPPRTLISKVNHNDNPWFPEVLEEQRKHDLETLDPALYRHIWDGEYYEQSEAQVFSGKWKVMDFEPEESWHGPYFGLDFGYSQDETAAVKCWIYDNRLYIEREIYQTKLELDDTAKMMLSEMPEADKYEVIADNARPESISYLKRNGLPRITACKKGKGSVEDGIMHMRSYRDIIVHTRCKNMANELSLYSYKIDRLSGKILPQIVDAYNHLIDATRYALEPIMKKTGYSWAGF